MAHHDVTVLSKNRVRKTLRRKGVGNHEVGPKSNESDNTSSIKLTAQYEVAKIFRLIRSCKIHQFGYFQAKRCEFRNILGNDRAKSIPRVHLLTYPDCDYRGPIRP